MKFCIGLAVSLLLLSQAAVVAAKETTLSTTADAVKEHCGSGGTVSCTRPCGGTNCQYTCDKDSKCTVTIFLKVHPKSGVTGEKTNAAAVVQPTH